MIFTIAVVEKKKLEEIRFRCKIVKPHTSKKCATFIRNFLTGKVLELAHVCWRKLQFDVYWVYQMLF